MNHRKLRLFAGSALAIQLVAAGAAAAQTEPAAQPAPAAEQASVEEIVVTGSRIQSSSTFNTPTPVTTVTVEQLQTAAPATLADGLKQLPSVTPGGGPTAGGGTANGGQNFLNLRALGNTRTLVLLDGHRFISAGPTGTIDTNLLPQGLVQRVDVVTGGASAAYGSDAVGGVINFVLDKKFTGVKAEVTGGVSQHGDGEEVKAGLTFGHAFLSGRAHLLLSGEYYKNKGVSGDERAFRRTASNLFTNPGTTGPRLLAGPDMRTPFTPGGLIVIGAGGATAANNALRGIQFGPGGVTSPYSYGDPAFASDIGLATGFQSGGDGYRVSTGQEILRPLDRRTFFARGSYDLTDDVTAFAEFSYGETISNFQSSPITSTLTIQRDNAYLAAAAPQIVAQMTSLGVPRFTLNRLTEETGPSFNNNQNYTTRYLGGLEGRFHGWRWEASVQRGENRNKNFLDPNVITANLNLAVDAVVNPANGTIVCRSTLTAPTNGCVPFNPFGAGAPSAQALRYVTGHSVFTTITKQTFAEANVSGELFNLPAGPLAVAAGFEYRKENSRTVADPLSNAGGYRLVNQQDFFGKQNIKEGFIEAQVPILKDLPFIESLDVNVAGRHTDYSTSGGVNTWKVGVNWQLNSDLRLRATRSRDIRAPNLTDLFATGRQNNITIVDTLTGRSYFSVPNRTFGNPDLTPEIADTSVFGVVYRPSWLPSFSVAVDYWAIRIRDAIGNVGGQQAVDQCNLSNQTSTLCSFVTRNAAREVIGTRTSPANLTVQKTDGVDFEASYKPPISDWTGRDLGDVSLRLLVGYVSQNITLSPLTPVIIDDAGNAAANLPHFRSTLSTTWTKGQWQLDFQIRHIGAMTLDKNRVTGRDTDFNHVASRAYLDGQVTWSPKWAPNGTRLFINVQNILNRDPPFAPSPSGATPLPTNPNLYDQVGRYFRGGVKLRY
jgi:outer membrane receptor protein involved in Fe transport